MRSILFVGGGTLGSLNPLIAVAQVFQQRTPTTRIYFWTSRSALDQQVVRDAGFSCRPIVSGKFRRYFSLRTLSDPFCILAAFFIACARLIAHRPRIVVSAGSYVAVPVSVAAWLLHIPVAMYQQDVQLGLANRLILPFAKVRVATTPSRATLFQGGVTTIGFALRQAVQHGDAEKVQKQFPLHVGWPTLLIIGGSSGAKHLNECVIAGLHAYPVQLNILHLTGQQKGIPVEREGYVQIPFTNSSLPDLYAIADLILCRAGSNVLAEIVAVGKPVIIIPLPGTHQEANASELERAGAKVLHESTLTPVSLAKQVQLTLGDARYRTNIPQQLRKVWDIDGSARFANILQQYV